MSVATYFDVCRFCREQNETVEIAVSECKEMVITLAQFELELTNDLPSKVCQCCFDRLQDAVRMKEMCLNSELALLSTPSYEEPEYLEDTEVILAPEMIVPDEDQKEENDYENLEEVEEEEENDSDAPEEAVKCCRCYFRGNLTATRKHFEEQHIEYRLKDLSISKNFRCKLCWVPFETEDEYLAHSMVIDKLETQTDKPYIVGCCQCDFQSCLPYVELHFAAMHEKLQSNLPFQCSMCGHGYKTELAVQIHQNARNAQRKKTGTKQRDLYECPDCPKVYHIHSSYIYHRQYIHAGVRKMCCEICGAKFRKKYELEEHMNAHNGVRPFACTFCEAAFCRKMALKSHLRSHTKEKPYKCKDCPKQYSHATDLKRHRTVHTGISLYSCDTCCKGFHRKNHLELHILNTGHESSTDVRKQN